MNTDNWFDDLPVIHKLPPEEAAAKLREVGEDELADAIEAAQRKVTTASTTFGILEDLMPFLPKPWTYPLHILGIYLLQCQTAQSYQSKLLAI